MDFSVTAAADADDDNHPWSIMNSWWLWDHQAYLQKNENKAHKVVEYTKLQNKKNWHNK